MANWLKRRFHGWFPALAGRCFPSDLHGFRTSSRTEAQLRGDKGEELAVQALRKGGMVLLAKNWRSGRGELDLVMREGPAVVFVEVRVRRGSPLNAYASIRPRKRKVLRRTAKAYLSQLRKSPTTVRFDVVAVNLDLPVDSCVHHYRGIPLFGKHFRP